MVQLWVNLPAFKNDPGKYQAIEAKDIPDIALDEHGSHLCDRR
jgi:redox-sensitive bicupin YhaK (pirin superfamily)